MRCVMRDKQLKTNEQMLEDLLLKKIENNGL